MRVTFNMHQNLVFCIQVDEPPGTSSQTALGTCVTFFACAWALRSLRRALEYCARPASCTTTLATRRSAACDNGRRSGPTGGCAPFASAL